jgi:LPS export ABC transporter protein LptC
MNKKTGLQVVMVLIIVIISLWFYLKYFTKNFEDAKEAPIIEKIDANKDITSTFIDDINYVSTDAKGNKYQITAKQAEIENENSDVMFLKDVVAFIFIKDSDKIKITSSFSEYNSKNYDTIFSGNVIVFYPGHKITGEYLDFSFLSNLGTFTTNVTYTGKKTNLFADKIEMNLVTKDTKIFMIDTEEKVLIKGTK